MTSGHTDPPASYAPGKQPRRPHHIREWALKNGFKDQTGLARAAGVDKSLIGRWYEGASPTIKSQIKLAELFGCTREELFRSPDEVWMTRVLTQVPVEKMEDFRSAIEQWVRLLT